MIRNVKNIVEFHGKIVNSTLPFMQESRRISGLPEIKVEEGYRPTRREFSILEQFGIKDSPLIDALKSKSEGSPEGVYTGITQERKNSAQNVVYDAKQAYSNYIRDYAKIVYIEPVVPCPFTIIPAV